MNAVRRFASNLYRPSPPALPLGQQREFEDLVRQAHQSTQSPSDTEPISLHPDTREPLQPDFTGDTNPRTGEQDGPKNEPVRKWHEGDWSFKGRVSDF